MGFNTGLVRLAAGGNRQYPRKRRLRHTYALGQVDNGTTVAEWAAFVRSRSWPVIAPIEDQTTKEWADGEAAGKPSSGGGKKTPGVAKKTVEKRVSASRKKR